MNFFKSLKNLSAFIVILIQFNKNYFLVCLYKK